MCSQRKNKLSENLNYSKGLFVFSQVPIITEQSTRPVPSWIRVCVSSQDGGIILNNPCALAVHESRLLWPNQPFQCVLSLGTGRYDNAKRSPATSTSLRAKISNLICSATDTEGVHTLLDDLLAPDVYFRFNPMLSAVVSLDESRPGALDQLQRDTQTYLERNRPKLARLCLALGPERSAISRTRDWMSERAWEMKQRWT